MKLVFKAISEDVYKYAQREKARVIIGELFKKGDKYYNVATYIGRNKVEHYTKTHVHWSENFAPGNTLRVFDSSIGKIGILVCFDSAFSEAWRFMALKGSKLVVNISAVPKNFPLTYIRRRLEGAALFNQFFVVFANRPRPHFSGGSMVIDPKGDAVVQAGERETIVQAYLDMADVDTWRKTEKLYPNRRPFLYRTLTQRPAAKALRPAVVNK
jgi:predicted amidohydrolase